MTVNLVIGGFRLNRSLFQQPASAATARVAGAHYSRAGHVGPEIKKLIAAPLPAAWGRESEDTRGMESAG
jgi:hypothetical protein